MLGSGKNRKHCTLGADPPRCLKEGENYGRVMHGVKEQGHMSGDEERSTCAQHPPRKGSDQWNLSLVWREDLLAFTGNLDVRHSTISKGNLLRSA